MDSNNIIIDIFRNYVEYGDPSARSTALDNRIEYIKENLMKSINKANKKSLTKLCQYYEERKLIESEATFIRGFSFAVQFLSAGYGYKL